MCVYVVFILTNPLKLYALQRKRDELFQLFCRHASEEVTKESPEIYNAYSSVVDAFEDCCQQVDRLKSKNMDEQILSLTIPAVNQDVFNSLLRLDEVLQSISCHARFTDIIVSQIEKKISGLQEARHKVKQEISHLQDLFPIDQKVAVASIVQDWFFEQKPKISSDILQDYVANTLRIFMEGIAPTLSNLQTIKENRHSEIMTALPAQINSCSPRRFSNPPACASD